MPQSLANFDAALKDNYGPGLRNSLNNSNPIFTELGRNTESIHGRKAVWSAHTGRSNSTGARAELAALPTADRQRFSALQDDLAYLYHTIKVSGQALHLTKGDEAAFARALETEIKGADKDLKNDYARQILGQHTSIGGTLYSGVIGTCTAGTDTNTLILANATASEMRVFFVGEQLDVVDPTTGVVQGTAGVSSVNVATRTIELDGNTTAASADLVVRSGNLGNEINGLRFLTSATQTYASIDPTTTTIWKSVQVGSSTTPISEVLFDEASEAVQTDGDGGDIDLWIVEHSQRRKLASQMQAQKRYEGKERTLTAGWKGLDLAYGTLLAERYCPVTFGVGLQTAEAEQFIGLDFTWDTDAGGSSLYKALDGSDAVEARLKTYRNLEFTNRNSHVAITMVAPTF